MPHNLRGVRSYPSSSFTGHVRARPPPPPPPLPPPWEHRGGCLVEWLRFILVSRWQFSYVSHVYLIMNTSNAKSNITTKTVLMPAITTRARARCIVR